MRAARNLGTIDALQGFINGARPLIRGFEAGLAIILCLLSGCATTDDYYSGLDSKSLYYRVRRGDTLYGIGQRAGRDYREIATWNGISAPFRIFEGQTIRLFPPPDAPRKQALKELTTKTLDQSASGPIRKKSVPAEKKSVPLAKKTVPLVKKSVPAGKQSVPAGKQSVPAGKQSVPAGKQSVPVAKKSVPAGKQSVSAGKQSVPVAKKSVPVAKQSVPGGKKSTPVGKKSGATEKKSRPAEIKSEKKRTVLWRWPLKGIIAKNYSQTGGKGLNISGKYGEAVRAAADGTIVYCGQGLIGYGNLVIVKHNAHFLSAYGNNSRLLVREGEYVKMGQRIADVGFGTDKKPILHFEIRRDGKPVNPIQHLPRP